MAEFIAKNLSGSSFRRVDLSGATFEAVDLSGATFRGVDLMNITVQDADLGNVVINAELDNVVVNGVDIAPLVEAELDRRDPDRPLMRPETADGFRSAWDLVERRWEETVSRARSLDATLLHESVGGEWTFVETLRHLVFATEAWVGVGVLCQVSPWHPLSLPWDQMPDTPGVPRDRAARPSLDDVLALRADRMSWVRRVVDAATDESLTEEHVVPDGAAWPPPGERLPVWRCLRVVLNEEYHHRLYAERDLAALTDSRLD